MVEIEFSVNLSEISWSDGWGEIAEFGIYGNGPDVSAIGTTWIGNLAAMQALRPFTLQQVSALGGAESFFTSIQAFELIQFLSSQPTSIP